MIPRKLADARLSDSQLRSVLPNTVPGNLLAGATARSSVGLVLMPMTVIKTRMESSIYHTAGIRAAMQDILHTNGFRGLFAGFWPTTLRDAPTAGLFLVSYEQARRILARSRRLPQATIDASAGQSERIALPHQCLLTPENRRSCSRLRDSSNSAIRYDQNPAATAAQRVHVRLPHRAVAVPSRRTFELLQRRHPTLHPQSCK